MLQGYVGKILDRSKNLQILRVQTFAASKSTNKTGGFRGRDQVQDAMLSREARSVAVGFFSGGEEVCFSWYMAQGVSFLKKKPSLFNGFLIEKKLQKLKNFVLASVGCLRTPFLCQRINFGGEHLRSVSCHRSYLVIPSHT